MSKKIKKAYIILFVLLAVAIAISVALSQCNKPLDRSDNTYISVTIPEGSSTADIANILVEQGVIDSASKYKIISKVWRYDGKYLAGNYSLSPSMSKSDIAKVLISGSNDLTMFTVPEGYTIYQTAQKLADEGLVDYDTFVKLLETGDFSEFEFLKGAQSGKNHLEGYLFPNTYSFEAGASEETMISTMLNQYDTVFTDEYRARAKELGYTENEIIIIASIIEREAVLDQDRGKIASVIYNRLKIDMPLQMCSTVQYILGEQKPILTTADTQIESSYNTYMHKGLPPGPICSPGEASIRAALYPEKTDYLYFVVSEKLDGSHNFSSDDEQFQKDTEAYAAALEKQEKEGN